MLTPIPPKNALVTKIKTQDNFVYCYSEQGVLRVAVYEPAVFRISFNLNDDFNAEQGGEFSKASAPCTDFSVEETYDFILIKTNG